MPLRLRVPAAPPVRFLAPALPAFALLVIAGACGEAPAPSDPDDAPASWTLEPDLRIGSLEGEDALSSVSRLALAPDGRLFVSLPVEHRVRVFGRDGTPLDSVGREGEGPGEFLAPTALGFLDDTLWVLDGRQRRLSLFDAGGAHVGDEPIPDVPGLPDTHRASFGTLLAGGRALMPTSAGFGSPLEGTDHPFPVLAVPRDGGAPDTLGTRYTVHDRAMFMTGTAGNIQSIEIMQQVFTDVTLWAAAPDGRSVVLAERRAAPGPGTSEYWLTRVDLTGDTTFSVAVPYEPVPVDPARVDSILARYTRGGRSESEIREVLFLPDFLPPVSDLLVADDGSVWVAREARPEEPVAWDVFDASGTLVARVETPVGFTAQRATGDALWGTVTDALDVPYIERYRVVR